MQLDLPPDKDRQELGLPRNCKQQVGPRELLRICLEAVQTLNWTVPPLCNAPTQPYRPQMLMTLLTYCYACENYGTEDVLHAAQTDWTARYICAHSIPAYRDLAQFRRRYRDAVVQSLGRVLQRCSSTGIMEAHRSARARVETAAIMDSLEL